MNLTTHNELMDGANEIADLEPYFFCRRFEEAGRANAFALLKELYEEDALEAFDAFMETNVYKLSKPPAVVWFLHGTPPCNILEARLLAVLLAIEVNRTGL